MRCQTAAMERSSALRSRVLSLAKTISIGFRSGTVGRQEQQVRAGISDGPAHGNALVAAQVVHHDDVARPQSWHQELCHPGQEQAAVDGTVEHARCDNAVGAARPPRTSWSSSARAAQTRPGVARAGLGHGCGSCWSLPRSRRRRPDAAGSTRCWWRFHRSRLRATSGRSCSVARRLFFKGEPFLAQEAPHRIVARPWCRARPVPPATPARQVRC